MKKSSIVLASCGGAAAAVAAVGVVVAVLNFSSASEARENADQYGRNMRKIYDGNPFPSADNIAVARTNAAKRAAWAGALAQALDEGFVAVPGSVTPGTFSQMREKAIERMTAAAPKGEGGASILPENFAFGFERYASGIPAEKQHVPRLVRQLKTMEQLVGILYDAGIVHFDAAGREAFEDAASDDEEDYGSRRRRGGGGASASGAISVPPAPRIDGKVPLERDRFAFQFLARETALVSILDAISSMHPYAIVTELSIKKVGEKVVFPDEAAGDNRASGDGGREGSERRRRGRGGRGGRGAAAAEAAQAAPAEAQAASVVLNERPAPRSARLVSGALRESPVQISMVVDVCSVPSARKSAGARGAAAEDSGEED